MSDELTRPGPTGWRGFWNRGGWWRAVLAAVVYLLVYFGASRLIGALFGDHVDSKNLFATPASVAVAVGLPVVVGSILLVAFAVSLGWLKELFGRQPIRGARWMWIAPIVVALAIVLRLSGSDYSRFSVGTVVVTLVSGVFIGLSEELLTRGVAVTLLRRAGYGERAVMILSSLVFALLHAQNILTGQSVLVVLVTMVSTFFFGIVMYLALRVSGTLIVPIVLHAFTDPSTFLITGGIDTATGPNVFNSIAGLSTYVYVLLAIVAVIVIRDRGVIRDRIKE
jgi:membrane protease YdiL (CAAX protease family)